MSDDDPGHEPTPPPEAGQTESYPTLAGGVAAPAAPPPLDDDGDLDDEWELTGPARGIRLGIPALVLLCALLLAAGLWGGAYLEKRHSGSGGGAAGLAARFRGFRGGSTTGTSTTSTTAGGGGGFGGFGGFGGTTSAASGTISVVNGDTLYVLTATGSLVKVTLGSSTTVTRNADTTPIGLRPGDTVVVQGTTASNGNVAATSVAATAPGVSSSTGGFGASAPTATTTTAGG